MNLKPIFAVLASVLAVGCMIPYIADIFRRKTTPHSYSWLVWSLLQLTAVLAMLRAGAGIGAFSMGASATLNSFTFLLSLHFGTKNITAFDKCCLAGALSALLVYFLLHNALLSVIVIALTDLVAFLPTFRKSYEEPQSETPSMYFFAGISCVFALLALSDFNLATSLYLFVILVTNIACAGMIWARRNAVPVS